MLKTITSRCGRTAASLAFASLATVLTFVSLRPAATARAVVEPAWRRIVAEAGQKRVSESFAIRNVGRCDLLLGEVATSCGCTVGSIDPKRVPPGETSTLTVEASIPPVGSKDVRIRVQSNADPSPELLMGLTLVGSGEVPYVAFASESIAFGIIDSPGAKAPFFIETRERAGTGPWLADARISLAGASLTGGLRQERSLGADVLFRRYDFSVELTSLQAAGHFNGQVVLGPMQRTGERPVILPVHGSVRPPIYPVPSRLFASRDRGTRPPTMTLILVASDPSYEIAADFEPESSSPAGVRRISGKGSREVFEVDAEGFSDRPLMGELVFRTSHPRVPFVRIPISILVASDH